jgi:Fe-S cluster biogenesis protein NfuA
MNGTPRTLAQWIGTQEDLLLTDEERGSRLAALNSLVEMMRPAVQADGGDLALVNADVEAGTVEVMLQGSCSSCAISATTLQAGVERILKDRLDWVTEVVGGVDESVDFEESAALGRGGYVPRYY